MVSSRVRLDLAARVRRVSRDVGLGVVDALNELPHDKPGWRAEQVTRGALRGIDEGLANGHLQQNLSDTIAAAVQTALSTALARSVDLQEVSREAARSFARGVLSEFRAELGVDGDGPLTRALSASVRRIVRDGASALTTRVVLIAILVLCAVALGSGLLGALVSARR